MGDQDELKHYGVKGMRWGVRKEEELAGDKRSRGGKPPESSKSDLKKTLSDFYSKKSAGELQAEGQRKLQRQADHGDFPPKGAEKQQKRDLRADKIQAEADKLGTHISRMTEERDALPPGAKSVFRRATLNANINEATEIRASLEKKAGQIREGKLTDQQKLMIGLGAAAAVGILAYKANQNYVLKQAGYTPADVKRAEKHALERTSQQWKEMFGNDPHPNYGETKGKVVGTFYAGLSNQKAMDRPEFTIPAGTKFQRLSNHEEDSTEYGQRKGAYATFLENDNKRYGGSFEFGGKKHTISFEAEGEVRVPNLTTVLAHLKQINKAEHPGFDYTDEMVLSEYHGMAGGGWSSPKELRLFESLRTSGYSAIVDDMDAGYLGDLPVVFFGKAKPATSTPRTTGHQVLDAKSAQKMSGVYA